MRRWFHTAILFSAICAPLARPSHVHAQESWPYHLQHQIARAALVSYKLRTAAADLCPTRRAEIGIAVDSLTDYSANFQKDAKRALNLGPTPEVILVAPGSEADEAGILRGDRIIRVNATPTTRSGSPSSEDRNADRLRHTIAALEINSQATLTIERNHSIFDVEIRPRAACSPMVFVSIGNSNRGHSDGENVSINTGLIDFAQTDDELALVLGHELIHAILHHGDARDLSDRRRMEDEADILGAALAFCAGYDVDTGLEYWRRFRKKDTFGFLRSPSHKSTKTRIAQMHRRALEWESAGQQNPGFCPLTDGIHLRSSLRGKAQTAPSI